MRRLGIALGLIAGILVVALVAAVAVGFWQVRRGYPQYDGQLALPGLISEVEVVRNTYGVPTIYADTAEDLFRAQGFVHAQDRFWQMDFFRLVGAGRLSEIAGEAAIETDTFLRSLGWREIAEAEVGLLSPQVRRYYEAYADGINAWLEQTPPGERGIQYTLLGLQGVDRDPEPWTVPDSLTFIRFLGWNLRHNPDDEADRALLASTLPAERVDQLYPPFPYDEMGTVLTLDDLAQSDLLGSAEVEAGTPVPAAAVPAIRSAAAAIGSVPGTSARGGVGSNSWVVGADRTASGNAVLANDPHIGPQIPGVFAQMGLRCREVNELCPFDVRGFSVPSVLGVFVGHNRDIAWGVTTPYVDTADLVVEQVDGEEYLTEDGMVPLETRTETLQVAGGDPVDVTIRSTRNGPLISADDVSSMFAIDNLAAAPNAVEPAAVLTPGSEYAVALRWTGSVPGRTAELLPLMNAASGWTEFTEALRLAEAFTQNIVYADAEGNTGYYIFGSIPIRQGYDGSVPVAGWTGETDWVGTIPFERTPHVFQPARGYLATANEVTVPAEYPYLLTTDAQFAYRGDRIRQFLERNDAVSVDDAAALQMDSWNWLAERMVPTLLAIDGLDDYHAEGQALLTDWNFTQPPDSPAAAYFNAVYAHTLALAFRDEIGEEVWPDGRGRWFVVLDELLQTPDDPFWDDVDTAERETRDDILRQAMMEARDELTESQSKDPAQWEWGRMHALELVDSAFGESGIGPVEWLFNRGPYPAGGGGNIVQATSWDAVEAVDNGDYSLVNIPTFRMVVDFGDLDSSRWVNQSGQSGHPGHPHYDDQIPRWQSGESPTMAWTDRAIEAETEHRLTLVPGAG